MASNLQTFAFRLVVRGNTAAGVRVRRVRVQHSPSYEQAWSDFEEVYLDMSDGLTDVGYSILPPAGLLVKGGASVGYTLEAA